MQLQHEDSTPPVSPKIRSGQRIVGEVESRYEVKECLGKGCYADVYRGVCKETGEQFALKRINKSSNGVEDIDKEIDLMLKVEHRDIIQLFEVWESGVEVVLVLEMAVGGELFERVLKKNKAKNKYTEEEAASIFRVVVRAVKFLHSRGIIHRDIKPENILLMNENNDLHVKLADFNLSKCLSGGDYTHTILGTMGYCAPEVLSAKPYTFSADYWSLGVCLYILLAGYPPFPLGKDPMSPIKTKSGKFSFPEKHWGHISEEAKDCIRRLLVLHPADRISLDDLQNHPWLQRFAPDTDVSEESDGNEEVLGGQSPSPSGDSAATSGVSLSQGVLDPPPSFAASLGTTAALRLAAMEEVGDGMEIETMGKEESLSPA